MTITDTATKFRYQGNAVTDTFAFSGKAFTAADLVVQIITRATDVLEETLTITTDYSVTILSDGTASIVTVVGKIPSALQDIQILRALAQTQTTSLPVGTKFPAKLVENSLDRAVGLSQDLEEAVDRSLKFPDTSSTTVATLPEPVDDAVLAFDGTTGLFKVGATNTALLAGAAAADASATAAASSASAASTSASNASTSETNASNSATAAAASASSVNLPTIIATDTGQLVQVNAAGTGYDLGGSGTTGQVWTSAGADAAAGFQNAGGGSRVFIETQVASSSATIDFTGLDSTYATYEFVLESVVPATDGTNLLGRVSVSGAFKSSSGDYEYAAFGMDSNDSALSTRDQINGTSIELFGGTVGLGSASGESSSGIFFLRDPSNASFFTKINGAGSYSTSLDRVFIYSIAGRYETAEAVDGFRFLMGSGNIASGRFTLYGISHA